MVLIPHFSGYALLFLVGASQARLSVTGNLLLKRNSTDLSNDCLNTCSDASAAAEDCVNSAGSEENEAYVACICSPSFSDVYNGCLQCVKETDSGYAGPDDANLGGVCSANNGTLSVVSSSSSGISVSGSGGVMSTSSVMGEYDDVDFGGSVGRWWFADVDFGVWSGSWGHWVC